MNAEEETRAAAYRASVRARYLNELARCRALQGNREARRSLQEHWNAVILAAQQPRKDDDYVEQEERRRRGCEVLVN